MDFISLRYEFDWGIPFREPYLGWLITGVQLTLLITAVTTIVSLIVGTVLAIMRNSRFKVFNVPAYVYIEIVRNIPGLFWVMFFYYLFPDLLPSRLRYICNHYEYYPVVAGILGLSVDNSAYVSDIVRTGLLGITRGRIEAAVSTGLNRLQQIRYVVLPEAFRIIFPALTVRMIHNFKNSSICMAVSAPELTWATQQVESITFRGIETTSVATIFYVLLSLITAAIILRFERIMNIDLTSIKRMND